MSTETSIATHLENDFEEIRTDTCCHGFYDWFCSDKSLKNRSENLIKKFKSISDSKKFNPETSYIFFKNNAPLSGGTYDDFRVCDIESGDVLFTVIPKSGHSGKAEVWGNENDFDEALVIGTWRDVKAFFNA